MNLLRQNRSFFMLLLLFLSLSIAYLIFRERNISPELENEKNPQVQSSVGSNPLLLSPGRQQLLKDGGTWADLFPPNSPQNRSQLFAIVLWWGFIFLFGWLAFPLVRLAFPGLRDSGYPLARVTGLLLLAYPTWLAGSFGVPVTRSLIAVVFCIIAVLAFWFAFWNRHGLLDDIRKRKRYILCLELLAFSAFLVFLFVRFGNPDLWHLYFGGEKPMDFSYFNTVLKSEVYPPYDPWFAGGVMNYYYYGFVVVGLPVKLLGIHPAVAYNLILPTLFSLVILGAFSIGWNINQKSPWKGGAFAALGLTVLGNLGAVRMVWQGWQRLVASEDVMNSASILQHIQLAIAGSFRWISGERLPYSVGDWYWIPSRAVIPAPNFEITEFPLFSFIYADPHAHLIALPITLLVIAWCISVILSASRGKPLGFGWWELAFGAWVVGSLRAANSWDHPTYLALASLSLGYALLLQFQSDWNRPYGWKAVKTLVLWLIFIGLSFLFFTPFNAWFRQGYTAIKPWQGDHVNLASYLTHWGLFLFILVIWLSDELIDWMAHTPLSALKWLNPYRHIILLLVLFILAVIVWLITKGIAAAWLVAPLGIICTLLLFRHDQSPKKRFMFFLAGTGLVLTLFIEFVALQGDRMNTIFKFYFQAWTMLALSAAAGLAWLQPKISGWAQTIAKGVQVALILLAAGCAFTTLASTQHKILDRMAVTAPHTLDGMAYMDTATLLDGPPGSDGQVMDLAQDARAIRWMQENVSGSPVIVEAHTNEYRHWGSRFTIYTGLPGIIGWENHQRQQRATMQGDPVSERIKHFHAFYLTTDREKVIAFLKQYQVEYIIVGQLERIYYPGPGMEKFEVYAGDLWKPVYQDHLTTIYRVQLSGQTHK